MPWQSAYHLPRNLLLPGSTSFVSFFLISLLVHSITWSLVHSAAYAASPLGQAQRAFQLQGAHYGTLPDEHPAVLRAKGIFRKLVRVAGTASISNLSLHVLATPKIIAQCYEQGIIVVRSRGSDGEMKNHEMRDRVEGGRKICLDKLSR